MELGGGSRNPNNDRSKNMGRSLRRLTAKPVYKDDLSEDSVEEVEVEEVKPKCIYDYETKQEKEIKLNKKLKDLGLDDDLSSMMYEEKLELLQTLEASKETAKLDSMTSTQHSYETSKKDNIFNFENDEASLSKDENENLLRLRSRDVQVIKMDQRSSTVTKEKATSKFDANALPNVETTLSDDDDFRKSSSQVHRTRPMPTLRLKSASASKLDPSIPFCEEIGLRIPPEIAARRKAILKKRQEEDWIFSDCSNIKDREERRKIIAERLLLQSKMILQNRIKKKSNGSLKQFKIKTMSKEDSVKFFQEWKATKNKAVEDLNQIPDILDDIERMDETEAPFETTISKFQALATTSQFQDDDDDSNIIFKTKKKTISRLSTKSARNVKSDQEDLWLSKNIAEVGNRSGNAPRNTGKRKLYSGLSIIENPNAGSHISQTNESLNKKTRHDFENHKAQIPDKFDLLLASSPNSNEENAKRNLPDSPEF